MKTRRHILALVVCLLGIIATQSVYSQSSMSMQVLKTNIVKNEPFEIAFTITNLKGKFYLPQSPNIKFIDRIAQTSSSTYGSNGSGNKIEYVYLAVANKTGRLTIPPAKVRRGLKTYTSNNLTINVSSAPPQNNSNRSAQSKGGSGVRISLGPNGVQLQRQGRSNTPSQESQDQTYNPRIKNIDPKELIFLRTEVNKKNVYVGEQVLATTKLYYKVQFETNEVKPPKYTGFFVEPIDVGNPMENVGQEIINGQKYLVMTISKDVLFPQKSGDLKITGGEVDCYAQIPVISDNYNNSPFSDILDDINISPQFKRMLQAGQSAFGQLNYELQPMELRSQGQTIHVKNSPKDSSGRYLPVGSYKMTTKLVHSHITQDDIDTLILTISGLGHPSFIKAPVWNNPYLDLLSVKVEDSITSYYPSLQGYKRIYYLFTSNTVGEVEIPPIDFAYFNPNTSESYQLRSEGFKLKVDPGKELSRDEAIAIKRPSEIHEISTVENMRLWASSPIAWSLILLPIFAFVGLTIVKTQKESKVKEKSIHKDLMAEKVALQRLARAEVYLNKNQLTEFYLELSKALWLYVSDKSSIPLSKISKKSANQWFAEKQIPANLVSEFEKLVEHTEMVLYAHGDSTTGAQSDYQKAKQTISQFEAYLQN